MSEKNSAAWKSTPGRRQRFQNGTFQSSWIIKKVLLVLLVSTGINSLYAQKVNWAKIDSTIKNNEAEFLAHYRPAKVLLLGTFHYAYPNRDDHKIDASKQIDIFSETRQREVKQIIDVIKSFNPTRIYVEEEEHHQGYLDSLYSSYKNGNYSLDRSEIYQLGFRAAKELGLPKVYAVDDENFAKDYYKDFPVIDSLWIDRNVVDTKHAESWKSFFDKMYHNADSLTLRNTLLETLLILNDKQSLKYSHGGYIVGGFNTPDDKGPDGLALQWYSRNLRIFNNILKTRPKSDDKLLIVYGSGHIPILQHLFESSPEFEVITLKTVVEKSKFK